MNAKEKNKCSYLPQGWREIPLWEVCENPVSGYSPVGADRPAKDNEMGVLKLNCIQENRFKSEKNKAVTDSRINHLKTPVSRNTLIVSRSNTEDLVGAVCYVEHDFPNLFLSDLLWRVSARDERKIDLKWLSYLLSFPPYRAKIIARANGTSDTMKKITKGGFLGILSPIYTVFQCTGNVVPEYLYAVFKTETFRHIFAISTNTSVDRRGSLRWKEFFLIRVPLPEKDEQQAIAAVLKAADTEIVHLENKLEALQKQKRGLMQKLLTGELTVNT